MAKMSVLLVLIALFSTGSGQNDLDLNFCGTWLNSRASLNLVLDLSTGCSGFSVSANETSLSVTGQITAQCIRSESIPLEKLGLEPEKKMKFCLFWEPLLDQLKLQIEGKMITLCWPKGVQGECCTDLTNGPNTQPGKYGIANGTINYDSLSRNILPSYSFNGQSVKCKALCDQVNHGSTQASPPMDQDEVRRFKAAQLSCSLSSKVEMPDGFKGQEVTLSDPQGPSAAAITVHIPSAVKRTPNKTSNVICTRYKNNSLFQESLKNVEVLEDVVEITVENEIITGLSEPIRISFHHNAIPETRARKCVSWDTRKDPLEVNWLEDGCVTQQHGPDHTECLCNHLTYFSILVQLEPRPVCHLVELTTISYLGCALSFISCIAVIIFLTKKRRSKEPSTPIHLGLLISLAFLHLVFFFSPVLANVCREGAPGVCPWVGAFLHYATLCSLTWMGIEVFHTFWMVCVVFNPALKPYVWNVVGFVLPAVPVSILILVGDVYGERKVHSCDNSTDPHSMCWMKDNRTALLAHYFTNMTVLPVLVVSGVVMLFMVYREIRNRDEWRHHQVAFLSIWGLSCLYGTTWGLTFLDFAPFTDVVLFLSCMLNSFQGFFIMLRFSILQWMRKQASGSRGTLGSTSSGSTRQHMLQAQEKS